MIEDALQKHLGNESDTELLLRRFDRVERDLARDHRDLELLSEAFGRYLRLGPAAWRDEEPGGGQSRRRQRAPTVTRGCPSIAL